LSNETKISERISFTPFTTEDKDVKAPDTKLYKCPLAKLEQLSKYFVNISLLIKCSKVLPI